MPSTKEHPKICTHFSFCCLGMIPNWAVIPGSTTLLSFGVSQVKVKRQLQCEHWLRNLTCCTSWKEASSSPRAGTPAAGYCSYTHEMSPVSAMHQRRVVPREGTESTMHKKVLNTTQETMGKIANAVCSKDRFKLLLLFLMVLQSLNFTRLWILLYVYR